VRQARELAVLEERNRLAREMHDTLAQGFTGILLQLEAAEQALTQAPAEAAEHLNKARTLARESLQEARRSVWNLRPQALDNRSLEAALREEVRRFNADGGAQASFSVIGDRLPLPGGVDACLLRICQESLSNVRKHAKASNISIVLAFEDGHVRLTVRDDGVGFDSVSMKTTQSIQGLGLTSMEDRVQFLDGTIDILSEPGKGTRVEVRVPTGAPPEVSSASEA
jgi:signal transduction histidine kinase